MEQAEKGGTKGVDLQIDERLSSKHLTGRRRSFRCRFLSHGESRERNVTQRVAEVQVGLLWNE